MRERDDALGDLAVARLDLPEELDVLPRLRGSRAPRAHAREPLSSGSTRPTIADLPAAPRLVAGGVEERRADSAPRAPRADAHHRVLPAREARVGDVRRSRRPRRGGRAPSGVPAGRRAPIGCVRIDGVEDLDAALEVGVGLGRAERDHPDRFSFPCRLAYSSPRRKTQSPSGIATAPIRSSGQMSPQTLAGVAPVEDRRPDPAQRIGRRRDRRDRLHPPREHRDRVVDAGDDQHEALRHEPELRALLGRDQRQDRGHHPDRR